MTEARVAAVILAAGASRRLGRPKQLVEYKGETLLARVIRVAREAGLQPVIVVLGAEHEAIQSAVAASDAVFVHNADWAEGIASSMRAGLNAVEGIAPRFAGVVMLPCDQPRLSAEHLRALVAAFGAEAGACIACSVYAGVRGVPALFPRSAVAELKGLAGDVGARKLLTNSEWPVVEVAFAGGEVDVDSPEDLAELD